MRPRRIDREPPSRTPKVRDGDSAGHLRFVRTLPCVASVPCGGQLGGPAGGEAHHLQGHAVGHGIGRRAEDRWTIPVSRAVHAWLHVPTPHVPDHGPASPHDRLRMLGFDPITLATELWKHTGDEEKALRPLYRVAFNSAPAETRMLLRRLGVVP